MTRMLSGKLACLTVAGAIVFALVLSGCQSSARHEAAQPVSQPAQGEAAYHQPGPMITALINAPSPFTASVSPARNKILLYQPIRLPDISVLAKPMDRLAGLRIDPANNGPHAPTRYVNWKLVSAATGATQNLDIPASAYAGAAEWAPDGQHFAFLEYTPTRVELWVGDAFNGAVHQLGSLAVNATIEPSSYRGAGEPGQAPVTWMPDSQHLLVRLVPAGRGAPPPVPAVADGPIVLQALDDPAPVPTYEDLLHNPHDAALFTYYTTAQLALVDSNSGSAQNIGQPGIFALNAPSPDGRHILVAAEHRPYSYLVNQDQFPRLVSVWNLQGQSEYKLADLPLADHHPILGVPPFPRAYGWQPTAPATLVWLQPAARRKRTPPSGSNSATPAMPKPPKPRFRTTVMTLAAPFQAAPSALLRSPASINSLQWGSAGDLAIFSARDFRTAMNRTWFFDPRDPAQPPRLAWAVNSRAQYNNPGRLVATTLPDGMNAVLENNGDVFLSGVGASPTGNHPFLDQLNVKTLAKQRLFQSPAQAYQAVSALLTPDASSLLVEQQSPVDPPNFFIHADGAARQISDFAEPPKVAAFIASIHARLITYKRADGVPLYLYLYLPPNSKQGERAPAVMTGYPLEYTDAQQAGQVTGSPYMYPAFPVFGASSGDTGGPLYLLAAGYAILDNTSMPIVGTPKAVNNNFVPQLVADCKAAIDQVAAMGYIDPHRVGVTGHSYGAFMVGNVLANSSLFAAGVAQSGAYNRTLTPFGFQDERRTFWQAEASYERLSPFFYANQIKAPIIIVGGVDDNNTGTFPIQSKRMYMALEGQGATVKWIQLPYEAHIYIGKQSVEEVEWAMLDWFDRYVKTAGNRIETAKR